MEKQDCPCKRTACKRHGDCEACRAHHAESKRKLPCEKQSGIPKENKNIAGKF